MKEVASISGLAGIQMGPWREFCEQNRIASVGGRVFRYTDGTPAGVKFGTDFDLWFEADGEDPEAMTAAADLALAVWARFGGRFAAIPEIREPIIDMIRTACGHPDASTSL